MAERTPDQIRADMALTLVLRLLAAIDGSKAETAEHVKALLAGMLIGAVQEGADKTLLSMCPTHNCPGDPRYAAPGRRHAGHCTYPLPPGVRGAAN